MSDHPCTQQQEPELVEQVLAEAEAVPEKDDEYKQEADILPEKDKDDDGYTEHEDAGNNQYKVKKKKADEKKYTKVKKKAKQFLTINQLKKRFKEKKSSSESAAPPCPYAYDDYYDVGGDFAPSGCFVCCFNPSPRAPLPVGSNLNASAASYSTYGSFVKNLIEKNDFYSKECNAHQDNYLPAGAGS